jgi:hypothetical protein
MATQYTYQSTDDQDSALQAIVDNINVGIQAQNDARPLDDQGQPIGDEIPLMDSPPI